VILTLNTLFDDFFYHWPNHVPKPPSTWRPIVERINSTTENIAKEKVIGIEIQFAVAGYKKEDLKVYQEGQTIVVEGDNRHRTEVDQKFTSEFIKKISVQEVLDLENVDVDLSNGILSIKLKVKDPEENRKYLLGG
jgi:HSP20 family molecular chaperone IbpA